MNSRIEVRSGGAVNRYDLHGREAVVGSSTTATISLPHLADLDSEHMLLVPRGRTGCWVSVAEGVRMSVRVGDDVLTEGMVSWGTDLHVGSITIRPCLVRAHRSLLLGRRVGLLFVSLAALALITWNSIRHRVEVELEDRGAGAAPSLFGERVGCSGDADPLRAGVRAEEAARARADRYPYDPRDGVQAVRDYEKATSCYDTVGQRLEAERARVAGNDLADRLAADYAAARLSLANAIEAERWEEALREAHHLRLLTSHLGGHDYVDWLEKISGKATARHHDPS